MTSYVPLLTVFTPPASCSDNSYTLDESDIYMKDINLESTDCYPDGFKDVWTASQPFSPGLCPDAYSRASYNIAPWAMSGEVMEWLCCPGGMFASGNGYSCYTTVASETELALPTGTVRQQNLIIAVHGVYVAIASSDASLIHTREPAPTSASTLAPNTSSPTPQGSLSTSSSTTSRSFSTAIQTFSQPSGDEGDTTSAPPSPQPTTTSSPSTPPPSPSRTTIGIAVGLSATLALLATLLAIAMIRRKRRRKGASTYSNPLNVRVFDTASEFNEDKRKWWWSPLSLSPASPFFDRRHSHAEIVGPEKEEGGDGRGLGIEEVQEADSRCVGNRELGEVQEADSRCVSREVGAAQEADSRCVSREIVELQGD